MLLRRLSVAAGLFVIALGVSTCNPNRTYEPVPPAPKIQPTGQQPGVAASPSAPADGQHYYGDGTYLGNSSGEALPK